MRLFGLPIFLWEEKNLKRLGDTCGGFIATDKCTRTFSELQWARLLVRVDGEKYLHVLIIKMEGKSWKIQLWWESPLVSTVLPVRYPVIFNKDGQREEDEGTTRAVEHVVEGLVGSTVKRLTREQVWGSTVEDLTPTVVLTSKSHTSPDAGRSLNLGGFGTLGLDLLDPQHKEDYLEKPKPQVLDGYGPFQEESSLGPKARPSTALLDLDPFSLKNLVSTLHEPTSGPYLDMRNDRYEKSPPSVLVGLPCWRS